MKARNLILVLTGLAASLAIMSGAMAMADVDLFGDSEPELPPADPGELPTPPSPELLRWIGRDGRFFVDMYDDRALPEDLRTQYPLTNPRWKPFAECMLDAGYETREPVDEAFQQDDLDRLVERLNAEHPAEENRRLVWENGEFDGLAGAFLTCANQWLTLAPEEFAEHGLEPPVFPDIPPEALTPTAVR